MSWRSNAFTVWNGRVRKGESCVGDLFLFVSFIGRVAYGWQKCRQGSGFSFVGAARADCDRLDLALGAKLNLGI